MLFNSLEYLIFLPVVVIFYYMLPQKYRWVLLLLASYMFYMAWKAEYAILIILSTIIDYFAAIRISKSKDHIKKKAYLVLSLSVNLGLLFVFKYFNFVTSSAQQILNSINIFSTLPPLPSLPHHELLLPVGISFYTFQTLSYTLDVYRGKREPEKHLGYFALYVSFFPQLVAGPIERSDHLLPQFKTVKTIKYDNFSNGGRLILWGLFKKIAIADNIAVIVDKLYLSPNSYSGALLAVGTVLYSMQILCDFSGYSDIAIGSAKILDIDLMRNFNRPYIAKGIGDFWRRWHISLSTWFRDYLFLPISYGISRKVNKLSAKNIAVISYFGATFITMTLCGLWHGANWTFVVWGALHALFLIIEQSVNIILGKKKVKRIPPIIRIIITFLAVNIGWVFFRAQSISEAIGIVLSLHTGWLSVINDIKLLISSINNGFYYIFAILVNLTLYIIIRKITKNEHFDEAIMNKNLHFRWIIYTVLLVSLVLTGNFISEEFIYFQF